VLDIVDHSVDRVLALLGLRRMMRRAGTAQMKSLRTGFQGALARSAEAAVRLLGDKAQVVPFERFEQVFQALIGSKIDAAVIPWRYAGRSGA